MKFLVSLVTILCLTNAAEWAPLGTEFVIPSQCTNLAKLDPTLSCPTGWQQYGTRQQDVMNCGMTNCFSKERFNKPTIQACADFCSATAGCAIFSYAPICGDENHYLEKQPDGTKTTTTVCTIHHTSDTTINDDHHGPNQIMCEPAQFTPAPQGPCGTVTDSNGVAAAAQYGFPGEDVMNCGQLHCEAKDRFNKATIQECWEFCNKHNCWVFSWADPNDPDVGEDVNHKGTTVCTTHNQLDITINDNHHPEQVLCRNLKLFPGTQVFRSIPPGPLPPLPPMSPSARLFSRFATAQKNTLTVAGVGLVGLTAIAYGINKMRNKSDYEVVESYDEESTLI